MGGGPTSGGGGTVRRLVTCDQKLTFTFLRGFFYFDCAVSTLPYGPYGFTIHNGSGPKPNEPSHGQGPLKTTSHST